LILLPALVCRHYQEIIELQKRDIARLEEIIALMKKSGDFN
jgi:hypothetical protein